MPMHRGLPNFVETNELKTCFYEDAQNEAVVVDGLKFMYKLNPRYMSKIVSAMDMISQHDVHSKATTYVNERKKVNLFEE